MQSDYMALLFRVIPARSRAIKPSVCQAMWLGMRPHPEIALPVCQYQTTHAAGEPPGGPPNQRSDSPIKQGCVGAY